MEGLESNREQYEQLDIKPFCGFESLEEMIFMRDGTALRTLITRPAGKGPFPTILNRTPYPENALEYQLDREEYAKRGFAYVTQYCRGIGGSEGEWVPNETEREDGMDTIQWLCKQTWVGNIGITGGSYTALTGWVLMKNLPKKVKTMFLAHYGTERFTSVYKSGMFRHDIFTAWAQGNAGFTPKGSYEDSVAYRPHIDVDEQIWGRRVTWYREIITATQKKEEYWHKGFWDMLAKAPSYAEIPLFIMTSWFDHHMESTMMTWEKLNEKSKSHSTLRIGAWNHCNWPCVKGTKCDHLENQTIALQFRWLWDILVEEKVPQQRIELYLTGADRWVTLSGYPYKNGEMKRFYFHSAYAETGYGLSEQIASDDKILEYDYDPEHPIESHGAETMLHGLGDRVGSLPQPKPNWRKDVLSFVGEPLKQEMDIAGKMKVQLKVSSSAEDTAFTAKVMEVREDGVAYNIRTTIATLAFREGEDVGRLSYVPGKIVDLSLEMCDVAWHFSKGSRIRVDIASSDFPQYSIHSNYPGIWSLQKNTKTARQTLYIKEGGCYIELPMARF